ncbi:MAG TPA: bis(5'-nucleosyl)-tetraphosphatase [Thermoplasmata archaeon]|nr:bis(5'-nucleosyl)-tetraphosphatase [Thermoplasmata archaeon]
MAKKQLSAGAVIFRRDGATPVYLLLKYAAGHWEFVKGHVEAGEEPLQTMRRECEEETGIKQLAVVPGFEEPISYFFRNGPARIEKTVMFFLAETPEKDVTISHEHRGFEWLAFGPARELLTFDNARAVLDKADERVKGMLSQKTLD